jgi:hypothetical protein
MTGIVIALVPVSGKALVKNPDATLKQLQDVLDYRLAKELLGQIKDGREYSVCVLNVENRKLDDWSDTVYYRRHALVLLAHAEDAEIGEYTVATEVAPSTSFENVYLPNGKTFERVRFGNKVYGEALEVIHALKRIE